MSDLGDGVDFRISRGLGFRSGCGRDWYSGSIGRQRRSVCVYVSLWIASLSWASVCHVPRFSTEEATSFLHAILPFLRSQFADTLLPRFVGGAILSREKGVKSFIHIVKSLGCDVRLGADIGGVWIWINSLHLEGQCSRDLPQKAVFDKRDLSVCNVRLGLQCGKGGDVLCNSVTPTGTQ